MRTRCLVLACLLVSTTVLAEKPPGRETDSPDASKPTSTPTSRGDVSTVAQETKDALVVFHVADRDGRDQGIGTGFFISDDGLIATNLHVIGEGKPFTVELANGQKVRVQQIHAADRHLDLAIVRVEVPDAGWKHLELGNSDDLAEGSPIVVMGNPYGLKSSVVSGVLSGRREVEGRTMLQVAVPIEPGNSGGPVLDLDGRVHGIVTMKSLVTENLGFAIESTAVTALLKRPNPVPIERWVTIGSLDPRQWDTRFGATWRQRAGQISVEGTGTGFGGRALCLATEATPELPFELAVSVKLDAEEGAAGLIFHTDEQNRHYGFYPSNGQLRFSCFEGPSVFQWRVLREASSDSYRTDDWNRLRVRIEPGRVKCFVNEELVFDVEDSTFQQGQVGLAKFRETKAQFRKFEVGEQLQAAPLADDQQEQFRQALETLFESPGKEQPSLESLISIGETAPSLLEQQAHELRRRADSLLRASDEVRLRLVIEEFHQLMASKDFDLLRGALLIARLDDGELDVAAYIREVERMTSEIRDELPPEASSAERFAALNQYLFEQNGFHGSRHDYYHPANSYLNRVIDDREGIPITLSVLYLELGKRLELDMEGVGLPGHFIVRWREDEETEQWIDVFEGAQILDREGVEKIVQMHAGEPLRERHLQSVPNREILKRMLGNLIGIAQRDRRSSSLRRYLEAVVLVDPDAAQYRGLRAIARFEAGYRDAALEDLDWFLENEPAEIDLDRIRELRLLFERRRPGPPRANR